MVYLHASSVQSHGFLTSATCLIDNRLSVKICDFGITRLHEAKEFAGLEPELKERDYTFLMWRAPEFLKMTMPFRGSQVNKKAVPLDPWTPYIRWHKRCSRDTPIEAAIYFECEQGLPEKQSIFEELMLSKYRRKADTYVLGLWLARKSEHSWFSSVFRGLLSVEKIRSISLLGPSPLRTTPTVKEVLSMHGRWSIRRRLR